MTWRLVAIAGVLLAGCQAEEPAQARQRPGEPASLRLVPVDYYNRSLRGPRAGGYNGPQRVQAPAAIVDKPGPAVEPSLEPPGAAPPPAGRVLPWQLEVSPPLPRTRALLERIEERQRSIKGDVRDRQIFEEVPH